MHLNATSIVVLTVLALLLVVPGLVSMVMILRRGYWHSSPAIFAALLIPSLLLLFGIAFESIGLLKKWPFLRVGARAFVCLIPLCFIFWLGVPLRLRKFASDNSNRVAPSKIQ